VTGVLGSGIGHSVSVDISTLRPGDYTLELEVKTADGAVARSMRELELVERGAPARDLAAALQQPVPREIYIPALPPTVRLRPAWMALPGG
jgi:hypothetical protein